MTDQTSKTQPDNSARTDDLLASGAEAKDGARGFDTPADPGQLQTGMEGIDAATPAQGDQNKQGDVGATTSTLPDNVGQRRSDTKS